MREEQSWAKCYGAVGGPVNWHSPPLTLFWPVPVTLHTAYFEQTKVSKPCKQMFIFILNLIKIMQHRLNVMQHLFLILKCCSYLLGSTGVFQVCNTEGCKLMIELILGLNEASGQSLVVFHGNGISSEYLDWFLSVVYIHVHWDSSLM